MPCAHSAVKLSTMGRRSRLSGEWVTLFLTLRHSKMGFLVADRNGLSHLTRDSPLRFLAKAPFTFFGEKP